jgi:hypothetical protein
MQKIAVGIQTLAKLRENDCVYVDKTMWAYELMTSPAYYFLSRPRRFGKSLFLNTLLEIFSGNKALFEGTFIYDKIKWEVFPVVHLSLEGIMGEKGDFTDNWIKKLEQYAIKDDILLDKSNIKTATYGLIEGLHKKYNKRVVVLIDEYDKPLLDFLGTPTEHENRTTMRYFFECLKGLDAKIHFVFITGITKFGQVSLFSTTNNLYDITLDDKYDAICGYTKEELDDNFKPQLEVIAAKNNFTYEEMMLETKHWYNGYLWGETSVYNPFSIACLLEKKKFNNYWFASGAPRFLVELLFKNFTYRLHNDMAFETTLALGFGSNNINTTALMFQTGYLTITNYDPRSRIYTLNYPNKEVEESLQMYMLQVFAYNDSVEKIIVIEMYKALVENNMADFVRSTNQLFAQIPEPIFIANRESFYHAIIYLSLSLVGITARSEEHTNIGRIDMVIALADRIFIIEYKIADTAADAMAQIHTKKYYEKYTHQQKPITLIGIALGATQRGIVDWVTEEVV